MRKLGKVGIVGAGGGCKGAISVGILKAIYEAGIVPVYLHGVSVNALNFAELVASGGTDSLVRSWLMLEKKGYNYLFNRNDIYYRLLAKANSFLKNDGTLRLVNSVNTAALIASPIHLEFPVHNELPYLKQEIYSNHDQQFKNNPELIKQYILAATCMQGFLQPIKTGEEWFSDGLYFTLEPAIAFGCDTIFVLSNDFHGVRNPATEKSYHRIFLAYDAVVNRVIELSTAKTLDDHKDFSIFESGATVPFFSRFLSMMASISQGDPNLVPHRIVPIAPTKQIPELNSIGFGKKSISVAIEHGYACGQEILEKLLK